MLLAEYLHLAEGWWKGQESPFLQLGQNRHLSGLPLPPRLGPSSDDKNRDDDTAVTCTAHVHVVAFTCTCTCSASLINMYKLREPTIAGGSRENPKRF